MSKTKTQKLIRKIVNVHNKGENLISLAISKNKFIDNGLITPAPTVTAIKSKKIKNFGEFFKFELNLIEDGDSSSLMQ